MSIYSVNILSVCLSIILQKALLLMDVFILVLNKKGFWISYIQKLNDAIPCFACTYIQPPPHLIFNFFENEFRGLRLDSCSVSKEVSIGPWRFRAPPQGLEIGWVKVIVVPEGKEKVSIGLCRVRDPCWMPRRVRKEVSIEPRKVRATRRG